MKKETNKIKEDILKEINHRGLNDMCGFGISIKENNEREKRGEPIELSKWIKWYFKKLES
jgi:hypothetical protein